MKISNLLPKSLVKDLLSIVGSPTKESSQDFYFHGRSFPIRKKSLTASTNVVIHPFLRSDMRVAVHLC